MFLLDDDFLPIDIQEKIKNDILGNTKWNFFEKTSPTTPNGESLSLKTDSFQFVHSVSDGTDPMVNPAMIISKYFFDKHNIDLLNNEILRIKSNILTKGSSYFYHAPHIDTDVPHYVLLYYINDSDGDTYFFDNFWKDGVVPTENDFIEKTRVSPKMGRAALFDGHQYHSSSSPINSPYRSVINIVFKK